MFSNFSHFKNTDDSAAASTFFLYHNYDFFEFPELVLHSTSSGNSNREKKAARKPKKDTIEVCPFYFAILKI